MNNQESYLKLLQIPVWNLRSAQIIEENSLSMMENDSEKLAKTSVSMIMDMIEPVVEKQQIDPIITSTVVDTAQSLANCTACALHSMRTQVVQGIGNEAAKLFIVAEAPTHNDDLIGQPYAGDATILLNNMLSTIGLDMNDVYITPYVKCSPYQNFITLEEEDQCFIHLKREMERIQPEKILLLGRNVAKYILKNSMPFDELRVTPHTITIADRVVPVYVSCNPYQLLRFPEDKGKAWQDIKQLLSA